MDDDDFKLDEEVRALNIKTRRRKSSSARKGDCATCMFPTHLEEKVFNQGSQLHQLATERSFQWQ